MEEVLVVRLIEARDLCPGQRASLPHPFVKLKFGSTAFKSKTASSLLLFCNVFQHTRNFFKLQAKKSLNPCFDEIFLFNIPKHISRSA